MGCDIHTFAETRRADRWELAQEFDVLDTRDYGLFGFLAGVRNYSHSPVIADPRGLPEDASVDVCREYQEWAQDAHHASRLTLAELLAYDYDQVFWDRRVIKGNNGAALAEEGEGEHRTLREFLGERYFRELDALTKLGDPASVRVVFWFDN